jgi:hypothetical protein
VKKTASAAKKTASPAKKAATTVKKSASPVKKTAVKKTTPPVKKAASTAPAKKVVAKTPATKRVPATKAAPKRAAAPRPAAITPVSAAPETTPVTLEELRHRETPPAPRNGSRRLLIGGAVALVVVLMGGIAAFALRDPAPSKASYIAKADLICGPGNAPVTAIVKPTSYPELSTASAAVVTATSAEVVQLDHLRRPAGEDGKQADAAIKALTAYSGAAVTLRDAASKQDDAATIAGTNSLKAAFADAKTKATAFGFTACGAGMQPGVDTTVAGSTGVIKTQFTAKADSLCRGASTKMNALPATPDTDAGLVSDLNGALAITQKLVTDLKALPVAPGDEPVVSEMLVAADKVNTKIGELRDAVSAKDYARADAVVKEAGPIGTDSDHQFDAYGLKVCGSNFGT